MAETYKTLVDKDMNQVQSDELDELLYARHVEVESLNDLTTQRGTPIPALFNVFYKFISNPSTVSVETFKRMVDTDDTIGSGVDFLTTALASRLGAYQHKNPDVTQWVNDQLNAIDAGLFNNVKEVLSAVWSGFNVSEIVWANTPQGFVPKKLVQLPPQTIFFETERTGELTPDGILQYQRNYNPALSYSGNPYLFGFAATIAGTPIDRTMRPDPYAKLGDAPFPIRTANYYSYLSIRIPTAKCIHYAFDAQGKFGNPYGKSLLRRCYNNYVMKHAFLQMLAVALDRKGTPLTVIFADPSLTVLDEQKFSEGTSQRGARNGIRGDIAAQRAFKNVHNDSVIVLPGKKGQFYDIEIVPQASNTQDFLASIEYCNKSILRSLLIPSLIFTNGDGTGSYSLGQEHSKTFDKVCDGFLAGLKQVLLHQLIKPMLQYNFPREVWEKEGLGDFGKRQLTTDEIDKEMTVVEKAVNIGAVDMNDLGDLNAIRDKLGMEPREQPIQKPNPFEGETDEESEPVEDDDQRAPGELPE